MLNHIAFEMKIVVLKDAKLKLSILITSLALEKCKKECNILEIILVQGFCPLKIKVSQFPGGFHLSCE